MPCVHLFHQGFHLRRQLANAFGCNLLRAESGRAPAHGKCAASAAASRSCRLHVPSITTGCMPTPALFATRKAPSLKRPISPVLRARPFREDDHRRAARQALAGSVPSSAWRCGASRVRPECRRASTAPSRKSGIFCTSCFDTHLKLSGSTYISGMSSIDWWFVTITHGRSPVDFFPAPPPSAATADTSGKYPYDQIRDTRWRTTRLPVELHRQHIKQRKRE